MTDHSCFNVRVLSLQSHELHGIVGNKACVFPLQLHGFETDFFNSVQFSNHTGYPYLGKGHISDQNELDIVIDGLEKNEPLGYDYIITGYIFSESFLECIQGILEKVRKVDPNVKYVCDPVLGDDGKFYVPESLIPIYAEKLISKAWLITPNQFESESLTHHQIKTKEDAINVLKSLQMMGPRISIISSSEILEYPNKLCCFCLSVSKITIVIIPKLEGHFTGTGDCLTALLLIWVHRLGDAGLALIKAVTTMYKIIEKTMEFQSKNIADLVKSKYPESLNVNNHKYQDILSESEKIRFQELLIIPCKSIIENPPNLENIIIEETSL